MLTNISNIGQTTALSGQQSQVQPRHLVPSESGDQTRESQDKVAISREAKSLQQRYQEREDRLEARYNNDAAQLEREYLQDKTRLQREYSQKKQSLGISLFA